MKWTRVGTHGMQSGEYRVAKDVVDDGALCTLYVLWFEKELLGYFNDFSECQIAAERHAEANK